VDGLPAPLIRADGLLRGIPIPQGQHRVRVWYAPASAQVGLAFSALGLVLMGALAVWSVVQSVRSG
jgi:uncharacterized membrane protein YfhO